MKLIVPCTALLIASVVSASAAVLVTPTGLTNSSGVVEFFPAGNMINDSGLSGAADIGNYTSITHGNAGAGTAWTTDAPNGGTGDYFLASNPGTPAIFIFTLDDTYNLTDLVFWGYHFGSANGNEGREFQVEFSTDGGGTYPTNTTVSRTLSDYTVGNAATLAFGGTFQADTVRVNITDNHFGGTAPGGDRIGVGELKLIGDVVPEPGTSLLVLFSTVVLLRRRRS